MLVFVAQNDNLQLYIFKTQILCLQQLNDTLTNELPILVYISICSTK